MRLLNALKSLFGGTTRPAVQDAALEQAIGLHEAGRLDEAGAAYRAILSVAPRHPQALHLAGVIQHQRGEHTAALQSINAAILAKPDVALFHFNLGNVLTALHEPEAAAAAFTEAARLKPGYAAAWFNLGKAHFEEENFANAVTALRRAFELDATLPGLRFDLATMLIAHGDRVHGPAQSKQFHREAAALLTHHWTEAENPLAARLMLAYSLQQQDAWSEAEQHYRAVLDAGPAPGDRLKAHSNLANCYNQLGRMTEALQHYRETLRLNPALADTASSIAACINYEPTTTPQDVIEAHRDWSRRFAGAGTDTGAKRIRTWNNDRNPERRLRIGLVSPDLRRHPVAALCAATLERLDKSLVEVFCYYNFPSGDAVTERLRKTTTGWRDIAKLGDDEVVAAIQADGIDILIDLAGHTTHNRLGVFARKPAPIQVSWLGYFNTTGLDSIDYFLTDPHSSPTEQDAFFVEKLVRLPHTRFCYEPWEFVPEVSALPATEHGYITFGCFNNLSKLNARVLALWARILAAVPQSRLVIQAGSLNDTANRERFAALATDLGIANDRIELRSFVPLEQAARAYHGIDIALDPFPFCGGMTSFESLWMGVPVVTLEQPLIAGRQTLAMLHNLGHPEWIARDEDQYVAIATGLANNIEQLAAIRRELRPQFAKSALADYAGFARDFTAALRGLWHRWAESGPGSNADTNADRGVV